MSGRSNVAVLAGGAAALLCAGLLDARRRNAVGVAHEGRAVRVVVLGAGFGGLNAALELAQAPDVELTVIDSQNHHLFQPLLYQVATAALSPADIASPVRDILPAGPNVHVMMGPVMAVDTQAGHVVCDGEVVPYDELVIATGSQPSYFGNQEWAQHAPGLKSLHDALDLRGRLLLAFERACIADDPAERQRLLTFVLIGAGPTGVEMAGSVAELAREMVQLDHELSRSRPRVVLVEAADSILADFPADLCRHAATSLRHLGVEMRLGTKVEAIEDGVVRLDNGTIAAATIIWTAGTAATPVAQWLGVEPGKGGRVAVAPDLRVPGLPRVQVIGDAALALNRRGKPLPALAPVAKQQGRYVAQAILRRHRGEPAAGPFRYRDYGTMATIGRGRAVADFGAVHVYGKPAWGLWAVAHIFFLIGFRSRLMVCTQWALAYVTDQRPGRLIAWNPEEDERARQAKAAR